MNKSDSTVKGVVVAAIRRHTMDAWAWVDTRLWDETGPADRAVLGDVTLDAGELPILYSVVEPGEWTLFTSRAVQFASRGTRQRVLLDVVKQVEAGNFKGHGRQDGECLTLRARDGAVYRCPYRTGPESTGTLAAINTLLRMAAGGRTRG